MHSNKVNERLKVVHLFKKYGDFYANHDVNLSLYRGEILGLLGPNGAGKTTLVRQISGILRPTEGAIYLDGENVFQQSDYISQTLCSMGQLVYIQRNLTAYEHVYYTGVLRGLRPYSAKEQALYFFDRFKLSYLKNRILDTLSGGEIRIVSFIATVIGFRPLMILDEPTNDIDPEHRNILWKILKEIRDEISASILLVTHNVDEAEAVVDRVAILQKGEITHVGTPHELISKSSNKVRIVFTVYHDAEMHESCIKELDAIKKDNDTYELIVSKDFATKKMKQILNGSIGPYVREIQILLPSLSDAYLSSVGEKHEAERKGI